MVKAGETATFRAGNSHHLVAEGKRGLPASMHICKHPPAGGGGGGWGGARLSEARCRRSTSEGWVLE